MINPALGSKAFSLLSWTDFFRKSTPVDTGYHEPTRILRRLDDFLVQEGLTTYELPRSIAQKWLAKRTHESARTQQQRIMVVRQFSRFLLRLGYSAYVPDSTLAPRSQSSFTPRILTHEEIRKLLHAVDALEPTARSPLRHLDYARSFPPPVWMRVSSRGSVETTCPRRRPQSRHRHCSPRKVSQRSLGSSRLVPGEPLTQVCRQFRKSPARCDLLPGARRRALQLTDRLHACFVNCYCSVGFLTRDEARDPGSTIFATSSQSIPYCVGIETARISTPNFLFWPPTWAISIFPELSAIFISPPNFFPRSQRESTRSLVKSFRGGSSHETHRFFRSRDELFDPLLGRTAESQPQYDQGIPRRVYSASAILPRRAGNRSGKTASRTDRCFFGGSIPGLLGKRKEALRPRTRNHRLAALHAFFRYVQSEEPDRMLQCQKILAIPQRRHARPTVGYLSKEELAEILAQPDLTNPEGRRDAVLLSILYDTGARVQELIDLSAGDVRLDPPAQLRLMGKGRKMRAVPLMDKTVQLLRDHYAGKPPGSSRTVRPASFPERTRPTIIPFGNPLHPSKICRQSTKQASESEPNGESAHASPHQRNAPVAEWNLPRHDPGLPGPCGCQNNSDLCEGKSRDETKRA